MNTSPQNQTPVSVAGNPPLLSVRQFLDWAGIGIWKFNQLRKTGKGPRLLITGRRILISQQAASDWMASLELRESPVK